MNESSKARGVSWSLALVAVLVPVAAANAQGYPDEDAKVSGKEIRSFTDGGERISVVLGDFRLAVGNHVVSGRNAVLWIRSRKVGQLWQHDVIVYVEGNARVVEPGGTVTSDRNMLVTVRNRGRLTARGHLSARPLKDFPLYRRAVAKREQLRQRRAAEPKRRQPPPLIVWTEPKPAKPTKKPPEPPGKRPVTPVEVVKAPKAPRVEPVHLHAARFSSQEVGTGAEKRRITIASGNVYLSQGSAESDLFLELRAQVAVVFSRQRKPEAVKVPWAPTVRGIKVPGGGEEMVTGVYLDGDVVVSRGDRSLRGPAAFYDFTTQRALIVEPVFRTVQEQRNIPIYIRAKEARALSERELYFRDAKVSTSDFYTPTYHIGAREAYLKDTTPYDAKGVRVGEQSWLARLSDATFNIRSLPVGYLPKSELDFKEGHTSLRKAQIGRHGNFGFGGETEWNLFRLLGLIEPEGFKSTLELNWYDRGPFVGATVEYTRENYSGYASMYGLIDRDENDDFGEERKNVLAPRERGRILARHKQFLPNDWQLQLELSYLCDENFLEEFFPAEAYTGKEQETLIYAKKQRDNWAITTLLKYRLNRFEEQTEAAPDFGFYVIGEPLLNDQLMIFSESRLGALRHRIPKWVSSTHGRFFGRLDTRNELIWPLHAGPVNVMPYAVGRATYWSDEPEDGKNCRLYGQVGVRANMHIWRVYRDVQSRLWDLHGIRHVITPEIVAFLGDSCGGVRPSRRAPWALFREMPCTWWHEFGGTPRGLSPDALAYLGNRAGDARPGDLFPMDPDIEQHLRRQSGLAVGVSQRLQTKRGPAEDRRTVDWMRIDATLGTYDNGPDLQPADGRFFFYRPEYSLGRNHLNVDYLWNLSDSTTFLADGNFDVDTGRVRRWNLGLTVSRDPRLRYYLGVRTITDLDSSIGTFAISYRISRKYSLHFFQQVDMDFDGHESMASSITIVRKFPRWYVGATLVMDHRTDDLGLYLTLWPEGIPEVRIGSSRATILSESEMN